MDSVLAFICDAVQDQSVAARKILAELLRRFVMQTAPRGLPFPRYIHVSTGLTLRSEPGPDIGRVARYLVISSFFIESLPIASLLTASRPFIAHGILGHGVFALCALGHSIRFSRIPGEGDRC